MSKLGCEVKMVVGSILLHAEFGPNDQRKDARPSIIENWKKTELGFWNVQNLIKKKNTNEHGGQMKFQPFQILAKKRTKEKEVQAQAEVQTQEVQTQAWWTPVKHTGKIQYFLIE